MRLIAGIDTLESDELCALCMVGNDDSEWCLIAGVKISSESMLLCLRPGSVTKCDQDLFVDMEMAGIVKSLREGHCEWSQISCKPSCEQTVHRVFSSPTRALNTGAVLIEVLRIAIGQVFLLKFHFCRFLDMTHRIAWEAGESEGAQWATTWESECRHIYFVNAIVIAFII